jgi:hypothetical protein
VVARWVCHSSGPAEQVRIVPSTCGDSPGEKCWLELVLEVWLGRALDALLDLAPAPCLDETLDPVT